MEWQLAEAKNRFGELVNRALAEGPQFVHRRKDSVVVLARREYERLTGAPQLQAIPHRQRPEPGRVGPVSRPFGHAGCEAVRVLLDTCALSELRRPKPNGEVLRTIETLTSEDLFVSVLSIGEIAKGIAVLREGTKKRALQMWLDTLERQYAERLLPIDLETSRLWGGTHRRGAQNRPHPPLPTV